MISVNVLRWIENCLCGRKQRVVLSGQVSDCCDVLSAVLQGYVLQVHVAIPTTAVPTTAIPTNTVAITGIPLELCRKIWT